MARRRKKAAVRKWLKRTFIALFALPLLYLVAALVGSLWPVNSDWVEPDDGTTVYIADNGVHADLLMPVSAQGLDWTRVLQGSDAAVPPVPARWIAVGVGERAIYLNTPRWRDLRLPVAARALTKGERIVHVQWIVSPNYAAHQLRLRPEEYRRLWAAVRSSFKDSRPQKIGHKGYGSDDAFYLGVGHANAIKTCNVVIADWLRLAGVKASLWPPFVGGLVWRYRRTKSV